MTSKIMLVEDDTNLSDIYKARFEAEGFQVIAAKDGEEALALAVKEKPDLIISDIMMPKISGFEMLDILRSTESIKYTKVIMMTALGQSEDKARAEKLGADRYLVKSQVTLEDVVRTAHEVLGDNTKPVLPGTVTTDNAAPAPAPSATPASTAATSQTAASVPAAPAPASAPSVTQVPVSAPASPQTNTVPTSITGTDSPTQTISAPAQPLTSKSSDDPLASIQDFVNQQEANSQAKADENKAVLDAAKAKDAQVAAEAPVAEAPAQPRGDEPTDHVSIANKKIITPVTNGRPSFDIEKALAEAEEPAPAALPPSPPPAASTPPAVPPLTIPGNGNNPVDPNHITL